MVSFCVYNYCPRKQPKRPGPMTGGCLRRLVIKLTGLTEFFCHFLLYFLSAILRLHGVTIFRTWGYWTYIVWHSQTRRNHPISRTCQYITYVAPNFSWRSLKIYGFVWRQCDQWRLSRRCAKFSYRCLLRDHRGNTQEDFSKFLTSNEVKHWNETQRERSATKTNTTLNVSNRVWKDFREI